MQIVFDSTTLHQGKMGSVTGVVYFDFGSVGQFPMFRWNDFVVVVLTWWMAALEELNLGSEQACFRFMDGPYWITGIAQGQNILLRCTEDRVGAGVLYEVVVALKDLRRELTSFSSQLLRACTQAGIQSEDLDDLVRQLPN
jgi:hypothetical protein